jgi:hypothetical protein
MGQELVVPQEFSVPAKAFAAAGLTADQDNAATGIGQSYGVISYRGGNWKLRYRGKSFPLVDPSIAMTPGLPLAPLRNLDCIILESSPYKSKSYYAGGYKDGDNSPPGCASMNGLTPDDGVKHKEAEHCALCQHNVMKTRPNGKKGKDCTDYKRCAVLILPTITQASIGQALTEPVFLRVPPASLNGLAILGETMTDRGFHSSTYITRITFNPEKTHQEFLFQPLKPIAENEAPAVLAIRNDPTVHRILGLDKERSEPDTKASEPVFPPSTGAPSVSGITSTGLTGLGTTPAGSSNGLGDVLPVIEVAPRAPLVSLASVTGLDSLGGATPATPQAAPAPAAQTAGTATEAATQDTGTVEQSDSALDDMVAGIIAKG